MENSTYLGRGSVLFEMCEFCERDCKYFQELIIYNLLYVIIWMDLINFVKQ